MSNPLKDIPQTKTLTKDWLLHHFIDVDGMNPGRAEALVSCDDQGTLQARDAVVDMFDEYTRAYGVCGIITESKIRPREIEHMEVPPLRRYYGKTKFIYANSGDSYKKELMLATEHQIWIACTFAELIKCYDDTDRWMTRQLKTHEGEVESRVRFA